LFGQGIGQAATEPTTLWHSLREKFAEAHENSRNPLLRMGFLSGLHEQDPPCAAALLDAAQI
jgi:hypothetical protein